MKYFQKLFIKDWLIFTNIAEKTHFFSETLFVFSNEVIFEVMDQIIWYVWMKFEVMEMTLLH